MKRVLITGATGFIGCRLAEVLVERGLDVVCLVRSWGRAARLARLPVQLVGGDVLDAASVRNAVAGCDVVFHCAVDFRAQGRAHERTSREGTRNVMQAALDEGVSRVVHVSSAAVHGLAPSGREVLTEDTPLRRTGHAYCDGKIAAERIALEHHRKHGLPVAVLRPTVVYGPFGSYSETPARLARERRLVLIDGGKGVCNCLYVDNLVQALLLAAERQEAVGQVFYVSDARTVTWKEFLERHAAAVGPEFANLPIVSRSELRAARRRQTSWALRTLASTAAGASFSQLRRREVKQGILGLPGAQYGVNLLKLVFSVLPESAQGRVRRAVRGSRAGGSASSPLPARPLAPYEEETLTVFCNVSFSIDKARRLLGYEPSVDFEEGMARTAAWIQWAGIRA